MPDACGCRYAAIGGHDEGCESLREPTGMEPTTAEIKAQWDAIAAAGSARLLEQAGLIDWLARFIEPAAWALHFKNEHWTAEQNRTVNVTSIVGCQHGDCVDASRLLAILRSPKEKIGA